MAFVPVRRNMDGIQHESLRRLVEPKYHALIDAVDIAFYNYWGHGTSYPVQGYDVQATVELSRALHLRLCNYLYASLAVELYDEAAKLPVDDKDRLALEADYEIWDDRAEQVIGHKNEEGAEKVAAYEAQGIQLTIAALEP